MTTINSKSLLTVPKLDRTETMERVLSNAAYRIGSAVRATHEIPALIENSIDIARAELAVVNTLYGRTQMIWTLDKTRRLYVTDELVRVFDLIVGRL